MNSSSDLPIEERRNRPKTNIPVRIKTGYFTEEGIEIETASGADTILWKDIELLCIGIISDEIGAETQRSGVRNLVRSLFFGEEEKQTAPTRIVRQSHLLDIFVVGREAPFRIDSAFVNYRTFLDIVDYQSHSNFRRLVIQIARGAKECFIDPSAAAFISTRKDRMKKYATVYDFELEGQEARKKVSMQIPINEIPLEDDPLPKSKEDVKNKENVKTDGSGF